jgi:hypothetical protein
MKEVKAITHRLSITSIDLFLLPLKALKRRVPMVGPTRYPRPAHPSLSKFWYREEAQLTLLEVCDVKDDLLILTHVAPP